MMFNDGGGARVGVRSHGELEDNNLQPRENNVRVDAFDLINSQD